MKEFIVAIWAFCFACGVAHGEGGFLGKLKKTVDAVADGVATVNPTQQPEHKLAIENVVGLKYRSEANELLNRIKVEQREASPSELYIIGRGFSYKPDGSPEVSYADMNQSVIPRYYEKAARGGNADALLYLLKFYGLGYCEVGGIGDVAGTKDEERFSDICVLKFEKFPNFKVPEDCPALIPLVDRECTILANKKTEEAEKQRVALEQEKEQIALQKADEEARQTAILQKQKEEVARANAVKAKEEVLSDPKIKYPKADLFKSNIKVYKDFESGVSYQWAVAKLDKDGIAITKGTPSPFFGTSLTFEDGKNNVTLVFASETDRSENPAGVLAMALIVLPSGISHPTALKKYKDLYPNATIKRETDKKVIDIQATMLDNGMVLIPDYAWLITKDHIIFENVKIDVMSQVYAGKVFYAKNIVSPKSLLVEFLPDGSYKKGDNLSAELEQAVPAFVGAKSLVAELEVVNILITDSEIEKVYSGIKVNAETKASIKAADDKKKKDADALDF